MCFYVYGTNLELTFGDSIFLVFALFPQSSVRMPHAGPFSSEVFSHYDAISSCQINYVRVSQTERQRCRRDKPKTPRD